MKTVFVIAILAILFLGFGCVEESDATPAPEQRFTTVWEGYTDAGWMMVIHDDVAGNLIYRCSEGGMAVVAHREVE